MGKLCGVGGSTIRDVESKGTYPQEATQDRIAAFFGLAKEQIWREPRRPNARRLKPPEKALEAITTALDDPALGILLGVAETDPFALGVAWAVIRGLSPFASSVVVTEKALQAVEEWHGGRAPVPAP
jgi:hypothetical protein